MPCKEEEEVLLTTPKSKLRRNGHFYSGMEGTEVVSHAKGRLISQKALLFWQKGLLIWRKAFLIG